MMIRMHLSSQSLRGVLGVVVGTFLQVIGCSSENTSGGAAGASGTGNVLGGAGTGASTGGAGTTVACIPEAKSTITHSVGNYDNLSCNKSDCHADKIGGWVYASAKGYPWIGGATITITNPDGSTLKTVSGDDGFFDFGASPKVGSPYKVCVSKCPSTDCNLTTHTSTDCLSSGCHAQPQVRIYVTSPNLTGTGGASSGQNCKAPTSGGPYVHVESIYSATSNQPCSGCHFAPKPEYKGGYLYDGPTSSKTVAEATIVLTPTNGSPITTVTGPDGMFFFGTNGINTTTQSIPSSYTACVSKCPTVAVCSKTNPNAHITNADCGTCHDGSTTDRVYLK